MDDLLILLKVVLTFTSMDDAKILFWHESWSCGEVVKKHFSRLFNLATEKDIFSEEYDVWYWC